MGLLSIFKKAKIKRVKKRAKKKKKVKKLAVKLAKKEIEKSKEVKESLCGFLAEDIMRRKFVHFEEDMPIEKALEYMSMETLDEAVVVKNGKPIGIIRDEDLASFFSENVLPKRIKRNFENVKKIAKYTVKDVMDKEVCKVKKNERMDNIVKLVDRCRSHIICVVDEKGKLVGIITPDDILKVMRDVVKYGSAYEKPLMKTTIDQLYDLVEQYKKIKSKKAANILKVDESTIENWAEILEKEGLIEIDYPITGGLLLIKK